MSIRSDLLEATSLRKKKGEDEDAFRQRLVTAVSDLEDEDYKAIPKVAKSWAAKAIEAFNDDGSVPGFDDEQEAEADEDEDDDAPPKIKAKAKDKRLKAAAEEEVEEETVAEAEEEDEDEPAPRKRKVAAKAAEGEEAEEASETETETEEEEEEMETTTSRRAAKKAKPAKAATPVKAAVKKAGKGDGDGRVRRSGGTGLAYARILMAKNPDMLPAEIVSKAKAKGHELEIGTVSTTKSGFMAAVRTLQDLGLLKRNLI